MKKYWQSLDELKETPEFLDAQKNEFAENVPTEVLGRKNAAEKAPAGNDQFSRRDFLKLMGFSVGAATLAACETPVNRTIPYLNKPEDVTPGVASWYASTYFDGHEYCAVLVKTREGRPIKVEGNKHSPITRGGATARVQSSVLSLYDEERMQGPTSAGVNSTWAEVDSVISSKLAADPSGIRILSSTIISPSTKSVIADFKNKYPGTKHVTYDAVSYAGLSKANENVMGMRVIPSYDFSKAKVIVSLGADFLANWLSPAEFSAQYAEGRKLRGGKKELSKHVQLESTLSLTGSNADVRVPVKPSEIGKAALTLYNAVASLAGEAALSGSGKVAESVLADCAKELWKNKGASLVVCGSNDEAIQTIVAALNKMLGNYGSTIDINEYSNGHQGNDKKVAALMEEMNAGKVSSLIIYNSNPVYTLPGFAEALAKVKLKVSLSSSNDETAVMCDFVCPDHHYLESWNDAEPRKNYFSLVQPTIKPIFNTRSAQESLLTWSGVANPDFHAYIQATWEKLLFPTDLGFTENWNKALHDGVAQIRQAQSTVSGSAEAVSPESAASEEAQSTIAAMTLSSAASAVNSIKGGGIEVVLYEKVGMGIGNQSNNPWLQELPDPITKCTWDNYITMNPTEMRGKYSLLERGDNEGDIAELKVGNTTITLPVFPQPGQALGTVGIALGYGRSNAGKVANGIGANAYQLVNWSDGNLQFYATGAQISDATGQKHKLACTQTHHTMMGRRAVIETDLLTYNNKPKEEWNPAMMIPVLDEHAHHTKAPAKEVNLWDDFEKPNHRWGLAIDLQACTGCSACVIGCSSENNVPVVGKQEVLNVREMHWMRIDRYYSSDMTLEKGDEENKGLISTYREMENPSENPKVVFQPVMCHHCNHAPCETVCPVLATTHSTEGMNQMIYNRCIGTRYCANNCPYKVRRFNWFQYDSNKDFANVNPASWGNELGRMVLNPDVVVRSRGVMEKCTFCIQRVQEGKLNAKKEGRKVKDGDIVSACQQSCPTNALMFGDLNDPESEVSKWNADDRRYLLLEEVGVQPNVLYLTKVRNS